jgi:cysteine-rich repeat protein
MTRKHLVFGASFLLFALPGCKDDDSGGSGGTESDTGSGTDTGSETGDGGDTTGGDETSSDEPTTSDGGDTSGDETTSEPAPACGDGNVDEGEECDDGNTDDGDYCNSECQFPVTETWTVTHSGDAGGADSASAVIMDAEDNIYVVGRETVSGEALNFWLRKLDSDGTTVWEFLYNGAAGLSEAGTDLAWHPSGDLLLVGWEDAAADDSEIVVMRMTNADPPVEVWKDMYSGPNAEDDSASGVTADSDGNVYVAGSERVLDEFSNLWVRQYDADGVAQWTETHNGDASRSDWGSEVVVDTDGNVYVGGTETSSAVDNDAWLRKYDSTPSELWTIGNGGTYEQGINALALDSAGDLVVVGYDDEGAGPDVWVRKLAVADGATIWTQTYNGPANSSDSGYDVVVDDDDNIYIAGRDSKDGQQGNVWLCKYDSEGNAQWIASYNNEETNLDDAATGIALDSERNVIAVGYETVLGENRNIWIRKYAQTNP